MTTALHECIVGSAADAVGQAWTLERRNSARPVPLARTIVRTQYFRREPSDAGSPGHLPGHPAAAGRRAHRRRAGGFRGVVDPLTYPYSACGKLFFSQGGRDWSGAAVLIGPNLLLTAGHCVYNSSFSTDVAFYPSYPHRVVGDNARSAGHTHLAVGCAWAENGDHADDYGMIWLDTDLGNQVGWLGLLWNADVVGRRWDAVGYPAPLAAPFDAMTLETSSGGYVDSGAAGIVGLSGPSMWRGTSGGPWLTDCNGSAREYVNGMQSFYVSGGEFVEYGAYFTSAVRALHDWISDPANRR